MKKLLFLIGVLFCVSCSEEKEEEVPYFFVGYDETFSFEEQTVSFPFYVFANSAVDSCVFEGVYDDCNLDVASSVFYEFNSAVDTVRGEWFVVSKDSSFLHIHVQKNESMSLRRCRIMYRPADEGMSAQVYAFIVNQRGIYN